MIFEYFYKDKISIESLNNSEFTWDIFISTFNSSERVNTVFESIYAHEKYWLIAPEYDYKPEEYPVHKNTFYFKTRDESEYINEFIDSIKDDLSDKHICIDITGFMRPHLLYLVRYLYFLGINKYDVIYSEPGLYKNKEKTEFSSSPVINVRAIGGYAGNHSDNSQNDLLILGVGYDHELVKQIAEHMDFAHIATLWGFPSLRADMYQENILRASKAGDAVFSGDWAHNRYFAKASDPFATASTLREIVLIHDKKDKNTNLYLSPLSTKPQVLGFAIYYIFDCLNKESSIVFPFSDTYSRETSTGISSIWKYSIDLNLASSPS